MPSREVFRRPVATGVHVSERPSQKNREVDNVRAITHFQERERKIMSLAEFKSLGLNTFSHDEAPDVWRSTNPFGGLHL